LIGHETNAGGGSGERADNLSIGASALALRPALSDQLSIIVHLFVFL
jgi:hypothetical protein